MKNQRFDCLPFVQSVSCYLKFLVLELMLSGSGRFAMKNESEILGIVENLCAWMMFYHPTSELCESKNA